MQFNCEFCNKNYKSYQSLWNHLKKIHNEENINICKKSKNYPCSVCHKKFSRIDSLKYHKENNCKIKLDSVQEEINSLKKKIEKLENKPSVIDNSQNNKNSLNNINSNNKMVNFIYINKTGNENIHELNDKETNEIFDKEISCVVSLIKLINFNERLPHNHSFCTKSLEGKYLLTYNTEESKVESTRKKYFYQDLLEKSIEKMELLYKRNRSKMSINKQKQIEDTIERLNEIKNSDYSNKILKEIKNKLIEVSYNNRETVLNTWNNPNYQTVGKIINDAKLEDKYLKELSCCDTGKKTSKYGPGSDTNSESDTDTESEIYNKDKNGKPNLLFRAHIKKL